MGSVDWPEQALVIGQSLSACVFFSYGLSCLISSKQIIEFERYGLSHLRRLTGILEMAGAVGLAIGFVYDPLRVVSAGCLALLMVFAVIARLRISDSLFAMLPAFILLLLNVFISLPTLVLSGM